MNELAAPFSRLFAGLDRAYGIYSISETKDNGKRVGAAITRQKPVTEELWSNHLDGVQGIGLVPIRDDSTVVFGAIDVDIYDMDPALIAMKIERLKLPLVPCRSKSGGVHAYCFASTPVSAELMRKRLIEMASAMGHPKSEIFPKQAVIDDAATGNWINMPYFNGVLGMRYCMWPSGDAMEATEFLEHASALAQSPDFFSTQLNSGPRALAEAPPCLEQLVNIGFPEGTRNRGLYNACIYLKKVHSSDNIRAAVDEFNDKYMDPPLEAGEVTTILKSVGGKKYLYGCKNEPLLSRCDAAVCKTRKYGIRKSEEDDPEGAQKQMPALGSLRKLMTDPPIWYWDVDGTSIELTTEELQSPRLFQKRVMEQLNVMPSLPKTLSWETIVSASMKNIIFIEVPEDASSTGQMMELLEKYCTGRAQASTLDEISMGKPFTEKKKTYFRMQDFLRYLGVNGFKEFKPNKVASIFKQHGLEHRELNNKGKALNVWMVDEFAQAPDGFDLPDQLMEEEQQF